MKYIRMMMPAALLAAAFLITSGISQATPDISKKEKKACTTCHEKGAKPTKENTALNATGKFYKEKKTLEGAPK